MYTINREFWICASHRVEGHPKCGHMHGHNYKIVVFLTGPLDAMGMVIDFGDVDRVLKPIIDEMDHRYIVSQANVERGDPYVTVADQEGDSCHLPVQQSTAEEIARYVAGRVCSALHFTPNNVSVLVQETHRNEATYRG